MAIRYQNDKTAVSAAKKLLASITLKQMFYGLFEQKSDYRSAVCGGADTHRGVTDTEKRKHAFYCLILFKETAPFVFVSPAQSAASSLERDSNFELFKREKKMGVRPNRTASGKKNKRAPHFYFS